MIFNVKSVVILIRFPLCISETVHVFLEEKREPVQQYKYSNMSDCQIK